MFIEILKDSLKLMKKNLNLTQLVFILFIIMTLATPVLATIKLNLKALPFVLIFFALVCAIFAGLFFAFKKSLDYEINPPKTNNPLELSPLYFAEFFQGTGCYFKKFIFAGVIVVTLFLLFGFSYDYIIHHFVVIPERLLHIDMNTIFSSEAKMLEFVNSLSASEQVQIGKISMLTIVLATIFGFLTMLYPISLVSEEKNFAKSFLISLKYAFKNLPVSFAIFLFFNICLTLTSLLNASVANSIIVSIVAILLQCYLNVWYILTLFIYYEKVK